jgi:hypothetical protein
MEPPRRLRTICGLKIGLMSKQNILTTCDKTYRQRIENISGFTSFSIRWTSILKTNLFNKTFIS